MNEKDLETNKVYEKRPLSKAIVHEIDPRVNREVIIVSDEEV